MIEFVVDGSVYVVLVMDLKMDDLNIVLIEICNELFYVIMLFMECYDILEVFLNECFFIWFDCRSWFL